jgi:hypothetical protein
VRRCKKELYCRRLWLLVLRCRRLHSHRHPPPKEIGRRAILESQARNETRASNRNALIKSGLTEADAIASLDNDEKLSKLASWGESYVPNWGGIWVEQKPYRAVVGALPSDIRATQVLVDAAAKDIGVTIDLKVLPVKRTQKDLFAAAKSLAKMQQ